ncbi:MAG: hypothetical protein ACI9VR_004435 [Cognaticolwellia sp.]|jgi:hypothetical protein
MSKKTLAAVALGTLTMLALGGTAIAKGGGHGGPFGGMHRIVDQLDLSPEQQELGVAMREDAKADHDAQRTSRSAAFDTIQAELALEQPDSATLHGLIDEQLALMSVTMHDRLDDFLTLHATFSAEQRATLVEEMDQAKARKETRMEEGEEGGRGKRGGR